MERLLISPLKDAAALRASRVDAPVRKLAGATMGTGWSLAFGAPETVSNAAVVAELEAVFALVIRQMSNWEAGSDLCVFNRTEAGWRKLPSEFFEVLVCALEVARLTGGAYDPALAAEVGALGFGPPGAPSGAHRDEPGWSGIGLDPETRSAFQPGSVGLDLSSIAKGYAVDLCAARLRDLGVPSFLMEIGGEFKGRGVRPDGQPWRVELALSDIGAAPGEPARTFAALVDIGLATSGDFVRRAIRDGRRLSHILDGRTRRPVDGTLSGVSVLHPRCMNADAWATALMALGPERGLATAEAQGLAAVFALRTPEGARFALSSRAAEMNA